MPLTIDQIVHLFQTEGLARYDGEPVSQQDHALQCGQRAEEADAPPELVAAALLHDLGHLVGPQDPGHRDGRHEARALPFLRGRFPASVLDPIRLHVPAKRYLCTMDPAYLQTLSPASRRSFELQGGRMDAGEINAFLAEPHALDAVLLRHWDDLAKSPTRTTPGWWHYRAVLERVSLRRVAALLA